MSASSPLQKSCPTSDQFAAAMQAVKTLHVLLTSVMADLSALRRTVLENSELREAYEHHLIDTTNTARPILAECMKCYEMMISGAEEHSRTGN